jgi:hypothetical protein
MMRSFILSTFIASAPVFAGDWVMLPVPDPITTAAGETFFVDPDINTRGNWPTIYTLRNYGQATARGHASDSMVCEVDCSQQLIRAVGGAFYSGLMGKGSVESWNRQTPWVRPAVDTALEKVMQYACTQQKSK